MQYFQPNLVKQNGIFNYIISTYSSNFSWFITLSAHPRNGFCELYTAIFEDKYTRFLTPNGEDPDIFIHLNEYKVKITHFAIHYTKKLLRLSTVFMPLCAREVSNTGKNRRPRASPRRGKPLR